jgi:hypothetical protein
VQTWHALVRVRVDWEADSEAGWDDGWDDGWEESEPGDWHRFGVDELTGRPMEFLGPADDALRQLEDELRPGITPTTTLERHDRGLLLVRSDEETGAQEVLEYRIIEPSQRPLDTPRRRPAPRRPVVDRSGDGPSRFLDEFQEVAGEITIDLDLTIAHLDKEVGSLVAGLLIHVMDVGDEEPGEAVRNVMSVMLWLFIMGREHANRGYGEPVQPAHGAIQAQEVLAGVLSGGGRPVSPGPRSPNPTVDAEGRPRSRFGAEFHEVAGDVVVDYETTLGDLDEEVGQRVNDFVVQLIQLGGGDEERIVFNLLSAALWMFDLGREHASRRYGSPVPRGDGDSWIPDTVEELFE